jgi:very-short-patch-repair endonuclease
MGILTKEIEVRPRGTMIKYYRDKGYDANYNQPLIVKVEDLPNSSFIRVDVLCDYCKKEIFSTTYHHYNEGAKHIDKHACKNCWSKKQEEVVNMKYGVKSVSQLKEVRDKQVETILNVYGVKNISQSKEIKEKKEQTLLNRFGVKSPMQSKEIKKKAFDTNIKKYGYPSPSQSPEIKSKMTQTLHKNGTAPTSKQQLYIFNLYKSVNSVVELNYPISIYLADICFTKEKLDIEYDGGFHDGQVKTGKITQEEFDRKELIRDKTIKSKGYKIIRIKSNLDRLPSDQVLLQMLSDAKQYFSLYPNHSWIEFNIDTSTFRNAENPKGSPYDFGVLRTIKDSGLYTTKDSDLNIEQQVI